MVEQKFYFLNEASKIAKISENALYYHTLQRQLQLSIFMPEREYIAVEPYSDGEVGQRALCYEGLIALTADDSINLIYNGAYSITQVTLAYRGDAILLSKKYPFNKPLPNKYMEEWDTHKL